MGFKLIAVIMAISGAGGTPEDTGMQFRNNTKFDTEQACIDYQSSENGIAQISTLKERVATLPVANGGKYEVELHCLPTPEESL